MLDLWSFWAAQLSGALAAAIVVLGIPRVDQPSLTGVTLSPGPASMAPALVVELLFTFALVYVVLSVGASQRQEHNMFLGVAVGVVVLAGMLAASSSLGGALNPAVAFGLSVDGVLSWQAVGGYVASQLLGAAIAAGLVSHTQHA
jgi:aquaporin Z